MQITNQAHTSRTQSHTEVQLCRTSHPYNMRSCFSTMFKHFIIKELLLSLVFMYASQRKAELHLWGHCTVCGTASKSLSSIWWDSVSQKLKLFTHLCQLQAPNFPSTCTIPRVIFLKVNQGSHSPVGEKQRQLTVNTRLNTYPHISMTLHIVTLIFQQLWERD